ncbi:MAG: nickel pincer cofactor biosynthesis protein LarC [Synergistales bacterium]|nr:nickel pincer cofactor biosynthesis protein LarC [Synergistales bacterium]
MKTLYLDCFAGIAGDMFIGALLNLVPDKKILAEGIKKIRALNPEEYELIIEETTKNGLAGINFDVKLNHEHHHEHEHNHEHHHRHLADIEEMISSSGLSLTVKREVLRGFSILAEAEAHVHGTTPDKIHFHEVGAVDSIIDITGAFILMEALGWPRVLCSPINTGSGTVECAHGVLPVPAPATEYLLHGLPVFAQGSPMERTTPTGALLAKILADGFSAIPNGKIIASGFGFGNRESDDMPNALRALLIDTSSETEINGLVREKISLLECNIDDMNPQDYESVIEKLFASEALDVWTENIFMKKNRPAVKLCCLARPEDVMKFSEIILKNTTSQGVRFSEFDRLRLKWKIEEVETPLGKIHVKVTELNGGTVRKVPEYEDVKKIAMLHNISMFEARQKILR